MATQTQRDAVVRSPKVREPSDIELRLQAMGLIDMHKVADAAMHIASAEIPLFLGDKELSAAELAVLSSENADFLERAMRLVSMYGYFTENQYKKGFFRNTRHSVALGECKPYADFFGHPILRKIWARTGYTFKTGKSAVERYLNGATNSLVHFVLGHEELRGIFFRMLGWFSSFEQVPAILDVLDLKGVHGVMDVGGATGDFLEALAAKHPGLDAYVLVDLPHNIGSPETAATLQRIGGKARGVACDALNSILVQPDEIDRATVKFLFQDHSNQSVLRFLKNIWKVLPSGGTVDIIEMLTVPGLATPQNYAPTMDYIMGVHEGFEGGGHVRTLEELKALLTASGFEFFRVIKTRAGISIVEGIKKA